MFKIIEVSVNCNVFLRLFVFLTKKYWLPSMCQSVGTFWVFFFLRLLFFFYYFNILHYFIYHRTLAMLGVRNCPRIWKSTSVQWPWWYPTVVSLFVSSCQVAVSSKTSSWQRSSSHCTSCVRSSWASRYGADPGGWLQGVRRLVSSYIIIII